MRRWVSLQWHYIYRLLKFGQRVLSLKLEEIKTDTAREKRGDFLHLIASHKCFGLGKKIIHKLLNCQFKPFCGPLLFL